MAKGLGLIGNFSGKVGNTVGYNLKDSNNKQTQGVRVYQPVVRNPKTSAQAEQRARMDVINATYRALKNVIQRGQEGEAYGNKSRLAWLSIAMKQFAGAWIPKGEAASLPAIVPLTKGSIPGIGLSSCVDTSIQFKVANLGTFDNLTIGLLSTKMKEYYPTLQEGDQVTFVIVRSIGGALVPQVQSFIIDSASTENTPSNIDGASDEVTVYAGSDTSGDFSDNAAGCIIVSREGSAGEHLRSSATLQASNLATMAAALTPAAKAAAVQSYMAGGTTSDWQEVPELG